MLLETDVHERAFCVRVQTKSLVPLPSQPDNGICPTLPGRTTYFLAKDPINLLNQLEQNQIFHLLLYIVSMLRILGNKRTFLFHVATKVVASINFVTVNRFCSTKAPLLKLCYVIRECDYPYHETAIEIALTSKRQGFKPTLRVWNRSSIK